MKIKYRSIQDAPKGQLVWVKFTETEVTEYQFVF